MSMSDALLGVDTCRAKRPPGRPRGTLVQVVNPTRRLGVHHFAFVRSGLLGLDLSEAFKRYLAWGETTSDPRHIEHRHAELLKQVLDAGRAIDATLAPERKITYLLNALRSSVTPKPARVLPTLDEWMAAEGLDPNFWSESDAIADYKAAHGIDNLEAIDAAAGLADAERKRVEALNHLQVLLATSPTPTDAIDTWFARPIVLRLRNVGVVTLANLVDFINVWGHRWHGQVRGFGEVRGQRVVAWLRSQGEALRLEIRASVDEAKTVRALRLGADASELVVAPRFGLVPLEQLVVPAELAGQNGVFRSHMANTLEASDDLQAIRAWLSRYNEKPATARSYKKEIERFVLWCTTVQRKAVSSVSALDCQAYRAFLAAVPDFWMHPVPVGRTDPAWRPFRKQPEPASQKLALVIAQTMFEGLRDAGYLVANPMRAVMKTFALPAQKLGVHRSFTEAEWAHVLHCLAEEPPGVSSERLRCVLELLSSSGIRLDELAKATHADLRLETVPDAPPAWVLSVVGKGGKQRDVPLADDVVELLRKHDAHFDPVQRTVAAPLIRGLAASVAQWSKVEGRLVKSSVTEEGGAALSAAGIYGTIKRFFARAAQTAGQAGLDPKRFEKASTHWMRHTFVRQGLVDGTPIKVMRDLVGHASIDTTSIYSTQELARKIKAVQGMKRRVVPAPD